MASPAVAEKLFRLPMVVEKLVSCELSSRELFNKNSDIAKAAINSKKRKYAALWVSLFCDKFFWTAKDYAANDVGGLQEVSVGKRLMLVVLFVHLLSEHTYSRLFVHSLRRAL